MDPDEIAIKFIADENVGKLARLLRMLGFDTLFFRNGDDSILVKIALDEKRIILTRDSRIQERRVIADKQVRLILFQDDRSLEQLKHTIRTLSLNTRMRPFSLCLECNQPLVPVTREAVSERVPPYVFKTQIEYVECPACSRVYWKGTHWEAMRRLMTTLNITEEDQA